MEDQTTRPDPLAALSDSLAKLAERGAARTVGVRGRSGRGRTGILWAEDLIVTAEEALERDDQLSVTLPDGETVAATLAGRDAGTDIALLRAATGPVPPLEIGPASAAAAGHLVLALGRGEHGVFNALGTVALAGGAWRSLRGGRLERRLRLGLRLELEGEGGPVLDHAGRLIGMAVPGPRRQVLAIPAETIARVVEALRTRGRIARGYLGLAMQPVGLPGRPGVRGVIVVGLDPDGPGAKAGVLLGDVLTGWEGASVGSVRDLLARLDPEMVGRTVRLDLLRAGALRPPPVRQSARRGAAAPRGCTAWPGLRTRRCSSRCGSAMRGSRRGWQACRGWRRCPNLRGCW
jgi:S1-C subfamily serine protease